MPLSTYMILQAPQAALIETTSATMAFLKESAPATIGVLDSINSFNYLGLYLGGQYVFKTTDAVIISAGGDRYFVIDENQIQGREELL